jgi:hypothetical protein
VCFLCFLSTCQKILTIFRISYSLKTYLGFLAMFLSISENFMFWIGRVVLWLITAWCPRWCYYIWWGFLNELIQLCSNNWYIFGVFACEAFLSRCITCSWHVDTFLCYSQNLCFYFQCLCLGELMSLSDLACLPFLGVAIGGWALAGWPGYVTAIEYIFKCNSSWMLDCSSFLNGGIPVCLSRTWVHIFLSLYFWIWEINMFHPAQWSQTTFCGFFTMRLFEASYRIFLYFQNVLVKLLWRCINLS